MDPVWMVAAGVAVLLVIVGIVLAAHDRREALGRIRLLSAEASWRVVPLRHGRNQAGPGLEAAAKGGRRVEFYYGET
ncbi:MAG TPA: hypothetical protein VNZ52_05295, partial [Candidatus Thermoplasmatota archaeon]|nr:hypothetical protein [Candidatus Thermoplasmatota archaeon]